MIVVDSSAILAAVYGEPGGEEAIGRMQSGVVSAVNLAETGAKLMAKGWGRDAWIRAVDDFGMEIRPFGREIAIASAALAPILARRGISFADRACLALGLVENLPVLTADRAWADLGLKIEVELIR